MKKKFKYLAMLYIMFLILPFGYGIWVISKSATGVYRYGRTNSVPVAYIASEPSKQYTSIEKALDVATKKGDEQIIYVIPGSNPTVKEDITIQSNQKLILPYNGEEAGAEFLEDGTTGVDFAKNLNAGLADETIDKVNSNRKNLITISAGKTLTVCGKLVIGGQLGQYNQLIVGHTAGFYTEILLENNASIINKDKGKIDCYGYVKEALKNNGSSVVNKSGSKLTSPFVIYDFKGGYYTLAAYRSNVMPFSIFDFPNIQSRLTFERGTDFYGRVRISVTNPLTQKVELFTSIVHLISSGEESLFRIDSGSITFKYNPANDKGLTTRDAQTETKANEVNLTSISIKGKASISSLKIPFKLVFDTTIDTSKFFLPISYKLSLKFEKDTVVVVPNNLKFLKGSSAEIKEGATLNLNADTTFYQEQDEANDNKRVPKFYSDKDENGKPKYAAKLINNGTINLNANFGGVISTTREGAVINIGTGYKAKDVVTYEGVTYTGTIPLLDLTKVEIKQRALGTIGYPSGSEGNNGNYPTPSDPVQGRYFEKTLEEKNDQWEVKQIINKLCYVTIHLESPHYVSKGTWWLFSYVNAREEDRFKSVSLITSCDSYWNTGWQS